jgi:hypothetical protein
MFGLTHNISEFIDILKCEFYVFFSIGSSTPRSLNTTTDAEKVVHFRKKIAIAQKRG